MGTDIDRACRILEDHNPKEVAERIGYKSAGTLYSIRSGRINMGKKLASRIVEAYDGRTKPAAGATAAGEPTRPRSPREENAAKKAPPAKKAPAKAPAKEERERSSRSGIEFARGADVFLAEVERQEQMASYEAVARTVVSKIVREEVVPALNEKLGRFLEELPGQGLKERAAELEAKIKLLEREIAEMREGGGEPGPEEVCEVPTAEPNPRLFSPLEEDPPPAVGQAPAGRRFWRRRKRRYWP